MSVITDDEVEGEDLLDITYESNCSALLCSDKGTVYECIQAVASYPRLPTFFIVKAWVRG